MNSLRIATRQSELALWQAKHVKNKIEKLDRSINVSLVPIKSEGDRILDQSLSKIGGKGLFIKELEKALLDDIADVAVHSVKDIPVLLDETFALAAFLERDDPHDALLSHYQGGLQGLPLGAIVGTSSLRRQSQILAIRPDLKIKFLRGNINTRINKFEMKQFDGIILAAAGLKRIGFESKISRILTINECVPAVGQGVIGIEITKKKPELIKLLAPLNHQETECCVLAERAMSRYLGGNCSVPIGGYARIDKGQLFLQGVIGSVDGDKLIQYAEKSTASQAEQLGCNVAKKLLLQGGKEILTSLR